MVENLRALESLFDIEGKNQSLTCLNVCFYIYYESLFRDHNMFNCVGCRVCELVCSYHHKRVFMPSISSIEVHELGKGKYAVSVFSEDCNQRIKCDNCREEEFPLCVMLCPTEVICIGPKGIEVIQTYECVGSHQTSRENSKG